MDGRKRWRGREEEEEMEKMEGRVAMSDNNHKTQLQQLCLSSFPLFFHTVSVAATISQ
jgi:hypothetical protein